MSTGQPIDPAAASESQAGIAADAAALWRRDLARHGAGWPGATDTAEQRHQPLWASWSGRLGGRGVFWLMWGGAGVAAMAAGVEAALRLGALPAPVGVAAALMWGPWLVAGLLAVHLWRVCELRRRVRRRQSDTDYLAAVGVGHGVDADIALAVRAALASVYGLPPQLIRGDDTAWRLSLCMESPGRAEFCAAFLRAWGSSRDPARLAERLGHACDRGPRDVRELVARLEGLVRPPRQLR